MDDPQRSQAQTVRLEKILLHCGFHIPRSEGVKIEHIGDGEGNRFGIVGHKPEISIKKPGLFRPGFDSLIQRT
jgi:hypothetical protein